MSKHDLKSDAKEGGVLVNVVCNKDKKGGELVKGRILLKY